MSVSFCLPHPVAVSAFMICRDLCACPEMLWMCVQYESFGCVAMGSALLCILRVQIARIFYMVWCEQSASCFVWI